MNCIQMQNIHDEHSTIAMGRELANPGDESRLSSRKANANDR